MSQPWFAAKCLFRLGRSDRPEPANGWMYEERIVLIRAEDAEEAIRKAELEAAEYQGEFEEREYLGYVMTYHLFDEKVGDGTEVYSLIRTSALDPEDFITRYFDDGSQHASECEEEE